MNEVRTLDTPRSTAAFDASDVASERPFFAAQEQRHVERLRVGVIGHRAQALETGRTRTEVELDIRLRNLVRAIRDLAGFRIDVDEILIAKIVRAHERAGRAVQLPQNRELAHREDGRAAADVDQNALE